MTEGLSISELLLAYWLSILHRNSGGKWTVANANRCGCTSYWKKDVPGKCGGNHTFNQSVGVLIAIKFNENGIFSGTNNVDLYETWLR